MGEQKKNKVLLVGWDAADWDVILPLVEEGVMPSVAKLINSGVRGDLATIYPAISPMLWTSIATGKRAEKHGIHGFVEFKPGSESATPISSLSRKTKAIWNILNQNNKKSHVIGWWPSHPVEPINGIMVSNLYHICSKSPGLNQKYEMPVDTIHPTELTEAFSSIRLDSDEVQGDVLRHFIPQAPELNEENHPSLLSAAKIIAECSNVHRAATQAMEMDPDWDFMAVYYDAIDHFSHGFMKYHPPKLDWIDEKSYEQFNQVVRSAYVYHDMMLSALMEMAGEDTTVILMSDHGFHSGSQRIQNLPLVHSGPTMEHRHYGVFLASGPKIKKGSITQGRTILDVAPTLLRLFDLPIGRDMDGFVMEDIFISNSPTNYTESWDNIPGEDGSHLPHQKVVDPQDSAEMMQTLADLGYIENNAVNESFSSEIQRELDWNLAQSYLDGKNLKKAYMILKSLFKAWPEQSHFGMALIDLLVILNQKEEAREVYSQLLENKEQTMQKYRSKLSQELNVLASVHPATGAAEKNIKLDQNKKGLTFEELQGLFKQVNWEKVDPDIYREMNRCYQLATYEKAPILYNQARILRLEGELDQALEIFKSILPSNVEQIYRHNIFYELALIYRAKEQWAKAIEYFNEVIRHQPYRVDVLLAVARIYYRNDELEQCSDKIIEVMAINYNVPFAHFLMGAVLLKVGEDKVALSYLHNAISMNPNLAVAHRVLAGYWLKTKQNHVKHTFHRSQASIAMKNNKSKKEKIFFEGAGKSSNFLAKKAMVSSSPNEFSFEALPHLKSKKEAVVIATGLPRSGTSVLMQMLHAGGIPIHTDDERIADEHNPKGYFEHSFVKSLSNNNEWLPSAVGQAVKVVAPLLSYLPPSLCYRVILMERPFAEIASSQQAMVEKLTSKKAENNLSQSTRHLHYQYDQARHWLKQMNKAGKLDVLKLQYHEVIKDPLGIAKAIAEFLGEPYMVEEAAKVVDASLWRNRSS